MANQSPPTEKQKRCKDCQRVKPASQFYRDKSLRDGLRSRCKPCEQQVERGRKGGSPVKGAPLRVELLVCPEPFCHHVGKLPPSFGYRGYCTGNEDNRHPKAKMTSRLFIEASG